MFRPMRRKKRELPEEAAAALLRNARRGVLAVNGDEGYPYAIPINFLYDERSRTIYFHGARVGHKADAIRKCDKVCFTVYGNETVKEEAWAPFVQSAVAFGRCRMPDAGSGRGQPENSETACHEVLPGRTLRRRRNRPGRRRRPALRHSGGASDRKGNSGKITAGKPEFIISARSAPGSPPGRAVTANAVTERAVPIRCHSEPVRRLAWESPC